MFEEVLQILLCIVGSALLLSMRTRERTLRSEIDQMKTLREKQLALVSQFISDSQTTVLRTQDDAIANLRREMQWQIESQQKVIWVLVGILVTGLVAGIAAAMQS